MSTDAHLAGKTAVITGSGRGIGRGIALALAQRGCNVAVNYLRHRDEAEETRALVEAFGVRARLVKANVGKEDEIRRLVDEAAADLGGVDIFVGNAASGVIKPITEIDAKAWDWTLNINARSILFGAAGGGAVYATSRLGPDHHGDQHRQPPRLS